MVLNIKIFKFLLTFLGSFVGQLIVRITSLDGSLDKWWLLLPPLSIPPLSLIPAYLIYSDKVSKGHGGSPFDLYLLIPAISSIVLGLMIEKKFNQTGVQGTLLKYLVNFLSIGLALYLRDVDKCLLSVDTPLKSISIPTPIPTPTKSISTPTKSTSSKISSGISSVAKSAGKAVSAVANTAGKAFSSIANRIRNPFKRRFVNEDFLQLDNFVEQYNQIQKRQSSVAYSKVIVHSAIISAILPLLPYIIIKIPYLNEMITTVGTISPYLSILCDILIRFLCIVMIYVLINMYNGRKKDKTCGDKYKSSNVITTIIISLVLNLLVSNKADLIPFNMAELNPQTE